MYHQDTKQLQETLQLELLGNAGVWMKERAKILWNDGRREEASALQREFTQGPAREQGSSNWWGILRSDSLSPHSLTWSCINGNRQASQIITTHNFFGTLLKRCGESCTAVVQKIVQQRWKQHRRINTSPILQPRLTKLIQDIHNQQEALNHYTTRPIDTLIK